VEESVVNDFNSVVDQLEEEIPDPEVSHFKISSTDLKQIWRRVQNKGMVQSNEKYCDPRIFKTQVEGLWEYLRDSGVIEKDVEEAPKTPQSGGIYIGSVTGSVIQQGSHNNATVNYQNEVQKVLDEIRPRLNAGELADEAKRELNSEFKTVEAQMESPKPKRAIIKESLTSARHILEHAFGAGMAHYFPLLLKFLEHHK
jgi:hypothetical protein